MPTEKKEMVSGIRLGMDDVTGQFAEEVTSDGR